MKIDSTSSPPNPIDHSVDSQKSKQPSATATGSLQGRPVSLGPLPDEANMPAKPLAPPAPMPLVKAPAPPAPKQANSKTASPKSSSPTLRASVTHDVESPEALPPSKKPDVLPGMIFSAKPKLASLQKNEPHSDRIEANKVIMTQKKAIFGKAKDAGSKWIDKWNQNLVKQGVNDAALFGKTGEAAQDLNCSFCTLGAMLGTTAGEVTARYQESQGVSPPNRGQQDMTVWASLGRHLSDDELHAAAGDWMKMLEPMRGILQEYVDGNANEFEIVDNFQLEFDRQTASEQPKLYQEQDLIQKMKTLPNGSRFLVYMKGHSAYESHWCYADKRNGYIIFRDYQQNIPFQDKKHPGQNFYTSPAITVDQLPLGPAQGNRIFTQGCFIAVAPKKL